MYDMKTYEARITPRGSTVSHVVTIQAVNLSEAKKLFRLQYPNCMVNTVREV